MNLEWTMANIQENDIELDFASINIFPDEDQQISDRSRPERVSLFDEGRALRAPAERYESGYDPESGVSDEGRLIQQVTERRRPQGASVSDAGRPVQQETERSRPQAGSYVLRRERAGPYLEDDSITPGGLKEQEQRMMTFDKWNWPLSNPDPVKLAAAAFFYEGYRDTVRCHYCDGTLQNWEPDDEPMEEHKRWFPECKFVKLQRIL